MRKKVYISGPLTSGGWWRAPINMIKAMHAALQVIRLGGSPYCPHWTWLIDPFKRIPHEVWMEIDLPWVECADVLLRLPGESSGADIEVEHARTCGVPVVYSLEELQEMTG